MEVFLNELMDVEVDEEDLLVDLEFEEALDIHKKICFLQEIIPDADEDYVKALSTEYCFKNEAFQEHVHFLLENNDYPKKKPPGSDGVQNGNTEEQTLMKEDLQDLEMLKEFRVESFLEKFPDPQKYFTENKNCYLYKKHSMHYLKEKFKYTSIRDITSILIKEKFNLTLSIKKVEKVGKTRETKRTLMELCKSKPVGSSRDFLYEVAFIEHEQEILDFMKAKELERKEAKEKAKKSGELIECGCCYEDELLIEEVLVCEEGHFFCKNCIRRSVEVMMGDGKYNFPCLSSCKAEFDINLIKDILPKATYEKVLLKRQEMEVQAAGIAGLESCPFCEYAEIPPEGDKIFKCKSCFRESCRLCKKENHIPLRCDEYLEKEKIKGRRYIEDKMTEALLRTCYKCSRTFIKEDGCNKMVCLCKAMMCYYCRKPVKDYSHFHDGKEMKNGKCPLYTNNDDLHITAVKKAGEDAKNEALQNNLHIDVEYDPFKGMPEPKSADGNSVREHGRRGARARARARRAARGRGQRANMAGPLPRVLDALLLHQHHRHHHHHHHHQHQHQYQHQHQDRYEPY